MGGWAGALCLSSSPCVPFRFRDANRSRDANGSQPDEDRHKAPSSTPHRPLSLQDDDGDAGIVLGMIIWQLRIFIGLLDYGCDQVFGGDAVGEAVEVEDDAVTQGWIGYGLQVFE